MDQLSIQRCLAVLEDRYRVLREMSESQLRSWENEKAKLTGDINQINLDKENLQREVKESRLLAENLSISKEELESKLKDYKNQINNHNEEKASFATKLKDAESLLKEALAKSNALITDTKRIEIELKDTNEELELRLLQLLQAQEELQLYFLKSQNLLAANHNLEKAEALASQALANILSSTTWRATYPIRLCLDQMQLLRREGIKQGTKKIFRKTVQAVTKKRKP